jgi:hypothetical protein
MEEPVYDVYDELPEGCRGSHSGVDALGFSTAWRTQGVEFRKAA